MRLATADACTSAAAVAGTAYSEAGAYSYYPAGCFWHTITDSVYFNTHPTGAGNYYAQPLCAGAPRSPAHMPTHTHTRLHGSARSRGSASPAHLLRPRVGMCVRTLSRPGARVCTRAACLITALTNALAGAASTAPTFSPPNGTGRPPACSRSALRGGLLCMVGICVCGCATNRRTYPFMFLDAQ